jgi:ABC-type oligopeptide transport system substrate-binding subunit
MRSIVCPAKTRPVRFAAAALLALLMAACAGGCDRASSPEAPAAKALERGLGQEPESVDPHLARTTQAHTVQRDLFEGLLTYAADGSLAPGVAERWEVGDDDQRYVFHLRADARWSNGEPVTAHDFVFSLRRLVDPETAAFYAQTLSMIVNVPEIVAGELPPAALGVEATDDRTLVISLSRTTPYFLQLLVHPSTLPVNERSFREHGEQFARPGILVSNGAYVLEDWVLGSVIELRRNVHYWNDDQTSIDVVRHHIAQNPSVELYRYRAGELDITSTIPTEAFASVRAERAGELRVAPLLSVYFYGMNLNHPELGGKPELREALSMAIDRETLVAQVVGRGEAPAYSFVPPGVANYAAPSLPFAIMSADERRRKARQLYAEAGYGEDNPLEIELRYNTSETHKRIAIAVQEMWNEVLGFEATLINEEFRVLVANMHAMQITQIFRLSWNADFNDASAFLTLFESNNPSNIFAYSNLEFDRLMNEAALQTNPERRRLYLEEAERTLLADHTFIPLYFPVSKHLVRSSISGWEDNVLDYHYSQHLRFADDAR